MKIFSSETMHKSTSIFSLLKTMRIDFRQWLFLRASEKALLDVKNGKGTVLKTSEDIDKIFT